MRKRFSDLDVAEQLSHELARQGDYARTAGPANWRDTKIEVTAGARATDPFREAFKDDNWHRRLARTAGLDTRELLREFERAAQKLNATDPRAASKRETAFDAQACEKLLPGPNKPVSEWLRDFAAAVDVNAPARSNWFGALRGYVSQFGALANFQDVDRTVVTDLVRKICEA